MAKVLMIAAPVNFRDEELFQPKEALEQCGHQVVVASHKEGTCKGVQGGTVHAQAALKDIQTENYDAVVFVGGGGSRVFFDDPEALRIAKEMDDQDKLVAAICIAPVILANAGLLRGKHATVYPDEIGSIESKGAHYTHPGVTADGRIVTADSPKSAGLFGQKLCEMLKKQ